MNDSEKNFIIYRIQKALEYQFESYSWENMIDDCDLTEEQKEYAKNHISYKAYIIDEERI